MENNRQASSDLKAFMSPKYRKATILDIDGDKINDNLSERSFDSLGGVYANKFTPMKPGDSILRMDASVLDDKSQTTMNSKQNATLDLISKKASSLKKRSKKEVLTPAQQKAKLQKEFAEKMKQQVLEKKAKEAEARREAAKKPPPEPYGYSVPDPREIPFPKIKVIRPEDRQEIQPIAEVLEAKRIKELTNNDFFKQFEQQLDLDPLIDARFGELDNSLEEISRKFQSGEVTEPPKKLVPASSKIDIAQVIKSKALLNKDFDLFERAPLLSEKEAIKILQKINAEDPSFPYEYSDDLGTLMIVESLEQVTGQQRDGTPAESTQPDEGDLEYWNLALDALGNDFLQKPKMPEDPGEYVLGEKAFTFKQYDHEIKREETLRIQKLHETNPEAFQPPKHKPTKRDLVKLAQTQNTFTAEEVNKIRFEYRTKIEGVKRGADKMRKDTIALIKDSTKKVIKDGCQHVVEILKKECLNLLQQVSKMKTVMNQQDLNLGKLCDKLKVQEKQIAEWAAKYTASKFKLDMTSTELTFLKSEENKGFVPLEQRLLRYFTAVESEEWEDPLEIKDQPNYLDRAFNFYGNYARLSMPEKLQHADSQMVLYYKCIIKDQAEANEHLKVQIAYAKEEALEYRARKLYLEDENVKLETKLSTWQHKFDKEVEDSKKRMQSLLLKAYNDKQEIKEERKQAQEVFQKELALSEKIREELQKTVDQMREEIKSMKQIIKVPRLHYKNIENSDLNTLQTQLSNYKNKEGFFLTQGVSKDQIRAKEIMKKVTKPVITEAQSVVPIDVIAKTARYKRRKTSLNPMFMNSMQKTSYGALNSTVRDNDSDGKSTTRLPPFINSQSRGITAEPRTNPASKGSINALHQASVTSYVEGSGFFPHFKESQTSYKPHRNESEFIGALNQSSVCSTSRNQSIQPRRETGKFNQRSVSTKPETLEQSLIINMKQQKFEDIQTLESRDSTTKYINRQQFTTVNDQKQKMQQFIKI